MLKVILINPLTYDSVKNFIKDGVKRKLNADECLSLGYLSAFIKQNIKDVNIKIYDHHVSCLKYIYENKYIDEKIIWDLLKEEINNFKPEIIGCSGLYEYSAQPFHETLRIVKEVNPKIITVVGGIYPTTCEMNDKNIDYVIKGEAEIKFCALIKKILNIEYNSIEEWEYISPLDDLPLPDRSNIPNGMYSIYGRSCIDRYYKPDCRTASVMISRGCFSHCTYCSGHVITKRDFRHRSVERIVEEIKMLKEKYEIEVFNFIEENATMKPEFTKELYQALIPLKIRWISTGGFYVNNMSYELCKLAIDSGIIMFNLAIESGSKRIQKLTKKCEAIIDKAPQAVKWIREINSEIYIVGFFMSGFSFETLEDMNLTLNLAEKLDLNWVQFNLFQAFKGCELYVNSINDGKENTDNFYLTSRVKNDNISKEYLDKIINEANLNFNFKNNYDYRHGYFERCKRDMLHVLSIVPEHKESKLLLEKINEKTRI